MYKAVYLSMQSKINYSILSDIRNIFINFYNFNTSNIDDYDYVESMLEDNNLPKDSQYTSKYKIVFD